MTDWLARWLRATLDRNPVFALSAVALLLGLKWLDRDGHLDAGTVAGAAGGLAVLQAYEAALLGVALLVLWPRRIAYETTSILVILAVVRYAAPLVTASLAAEGSPAAAAALGLALAALMALKGEAVARRACVDLRPWERAHDYVLYAVAAAGLPLLADRLCAWTPATLSPGQGRLLQLGACWALAALLAPLATGLPAAAGATGRCRRAAAVWRCLSCVGLPALLASALWLAGEPPGLVSVAPLLLALVAVGLAVARSAGLEAPGWVAHLPAACGLAVALLPEALALGRVPVLPRAAAALVCLGAGAAFVPLVAPSGVRAGLRSLGALAAVLPLCLAPSFAAAEGYGLVLALGGVAAGAVRRHDGWLARSAVAASLLAVHWTWSGDPASSLRLLQGGGVALAILLAWARPEGRLSAWVAAGLSAGPAAVALLGGPAPPGLVVSCSVLAGALALALAGRRLPHLALVLAGSGQALGLGLRHALAAVDPGVLLVLAGFAAIPAGTAVALLRGRRAGTETVAA